MTASRSRLFRWYRSGWGRYTQSDPAGLLGSYEYAFDNAIRFDDPRGLFTQDPASTFNIPSMPGKQPNLDCCSKRSIDKFLRNVDKQIKRLEEGQSLKGRVIASQTVQWSCVKSTGVCTMKPYSDPWSFQRYDDDDCVNYCINFHEWVHHTDNRSFPKAWEDAADAAHDYKQIKDFLEKPAYDATRTYLENFLKQVNNP